MSDPQPSTSIQPPVAAPSPAPASNSTTNSNPPQPAALISADQPPQSQSQPQTATSPSTVMSSTSKSVAASISDPPAPTQAAPTSPATSPPTASASASKDQQPPSDVEAAQAREKQAQKEKEKEKARVKAKELEREKEQKERELAHERTLQREHETRILWYSLPHHDQPDVYSDTDASASSDLSDIEPPFPNIRQPYHPPPTSTDYIHLSNLEPAQASSSRSTLPTSYGHGHIVTSRLFAGSGGSTSRSGSEPHPPLIRADSNMTGMSSHSHSNRVGTSNQIADGIESEEEDDFEDEERKELHGNRSGNRGNKLRRSQGVRWARRRKLGGWTEARTEKGMADRNRVRVASMQKAAVQSLLRSAPLPHPASFSLPPDPSSSRLSPSSPLHSSSGLTSTALAPSLLRPVITPRALLASHTLKHTFRNPHIGALAKTALDLRESEGVVERALGRCFAAMEWDSRSPESEDEDPIEDKNRKRKRRKPNGDTDDEEDEEPIEDGDDDPKGKKKATTNGESTANGDEDLGAVAMEVDGTPQQNGDANNQTQDEGPAKIEAEPIDHESSDAMSLSVNASNPAFSRLEQLFITPGGLPVSTDPDVSGSSNPNESANMTLLSVANQRAIVRAALECLHELSSDSREYVERLEEVRNRLAGVRRERAETWGALRTWSLDREDAREGREKEKIRERDEREREEELKREGEMKKGTVRTNAKRR